MKTLLLILTVGGAAFMSAQAQQHGHATMLQNAEGGTTTLSAEQIAQLLAGDGMGLAKPAELNHYPGPKHVIELAKDLGLSAGQQRQVEAIRADMLAAAKKLGADIVDTERTLDMAFQNAHIDTRRLHDLTSTIGKLQGELRAVHLSAHLATQKLLAPEQITRYDILRGYAK